jgi:hypothetical protein
MTWVRHQLLTSSIADETDEPSNAKPAKPAKPQNDAIFFATLAGFAFFFVISVSRA